MTGLLPLSDPRNPTIYLIDDSATMREVIRIAFQREKMDVVTCPDAATALAQMEVKKPDVVVTDVIMPDKDGYEVCQFIKQHPQLSATPVILLSGVVNREVAEKAFRVKADELIRKPFQPQDLIARVRQLLAPQAPALPAPALPVTAARPVRPVTLDSIFAAPASPRPQPAPVAAPVAVASQPTPPVRNPAGASLHSPRPATADAHKVRLEVLRLENLVKKLQSELAAEREYARALEAHIKTLQDVE